MQLFSILAHICVLRNKCNLIGWKLYIFKVCFKPTVKMYNKDIGLPHVNLFLARRFLGV